MSSLDVMVLLGVAFVISIIVVAVNIHRPHHRSIDVVVLYLALFFGIAAGSGCLVIAKTLDQQNRAAR